MTERPSPMELAMAWLRQRDLNFVQKTPYQLKIGREVSYYPHKGTIFIDGEIAAQDEKGLGALEQVLTELGYLNTDDRAQTV